MAYKKKVIVFGFSGSGKSTLLRLLDGHALVLGTQLREMFTRIFYHGREELIRRSSLDNVRSKSSSYGFTLLHEGQNRRVRLSTLRALLARHTYYHIIEEDAACRVTYSGAASSDKTLISFDFDFEDFERRWKKALFDGSGPKTPEEVIDILYMAFFKAWRNYPVEYEKAKYVVYCGAEEPEELDFVLNNDFDVKVIYINRDLKGALATRILRLQEAGATLQKGYAGYKDMVLGNGLVRELVKKKRRALEWAKAYPSRFLIIDFESLILDTPACMSKIADFLKIPFDPCLLIPSHLGQPLDEGKGQYIGQINDDWRSLFGPSDIALIERQERNAARPLFRYAVRAVNYTRIQLRERAKFLERLTSWMKAD